VTDPGGVILRANQRAGESFACAPQDLVGQPLPDLMAPDDRGSLEAGIGGLEIAEWDAEWIGYGGRSGTSVGGLSPIEPSKPSHAGVTMGAGKAPVVVTPFRRRLPSSWVTAAPPLELFR
jgi:hypothetical protein